MAMTLGFSVGKPTFPLSATTRSSARRGQRMTTQALAVPAEFGYVAGSVAFSALASQFLAVKVAIARRQFAVPYPQMYAEGKSDDAMKFNCTQRAHQNMLEYLPNALACQIVMGLQFPITAAALGFLWTVGRLIYAAGYSSGDPAKRAPGSALAGILYLVLILGAGYAGVTMSGIVGGV